MSTATPNFSFTLPAVADPIDQDLWGTELNTNFSSIDTLLLGLLPTGVILPYSAASAPTGFLLCYGQAVSRSTYATLFALISTTYGVGNGTTTFNLPDMRGRIALGLDNLGGSAAGRVAAATALNTSGGAETTTPTGTVAVTVASHTLTAAEIPPLTYTVAVANAADLTPWNYLDHTNGQNGGIGTTTAPITTNAGGGAHGHSGSSGTFTGNSVETMSPWIGLAAIIKY